MACTDTDKQSRNCANALRLDADICAVSDYNEQITAEIKTQNLKKVFSLGDIRLYECPLTYITEETRNIQRIVYKLGESGPLYYDGGWANQPYWLWEAVEIYRLETLREIERKKNNGHGKKT